MARVHAAAGTPRGDAAGPGSSPRCHRAVGPRRSPRRVVRAPVATAARTRGPPRAPRAGRVGRIPLGTGAAPPAAVPRARAPPRALRSACQPATPFGAPPLQHLPAALRRHALPESVRLGAPATVRLERPLHDFLLVRALRTARPSYRWAHDRVKRRTRRPAGVERLPPLDPRAMVGRSVRGWSVARAWLLRAGSRPGPGRGNRVRQATTAALPKLSTAVDKCVRNSFP